MAEGKAKLLKALTDNKIDVSVVCGLYNVKAIDNMTMNQLENANSNIDKIKAKAEEKKK